MTEVSESIELELEPIPPDTIASSKAELTSIIQKALQEAEQDDLLSNAQINIQVEKTFPTDAVIVVGFTFLSGVALETYKALVLPALKKRFAVRERPKLKPKKSSRK
jgi:hypothetical protein